MCLNYWIPTINGIISVNISLSNKLPFIQNNVFFKTINKFIKVLVFGNSNRRNQSFFKISQIIW